MDNKTAREEIARIIRRHTHHSSETIADAIIGAGYGKIEEVLTEFVEKLKKNSKIHYPKFYKDGYYEVTDETIDETLKETLKK